MSPTPRWRLEDAESRNAEAPASFFIPPAAKRHTLVPGDRVKLLFAFESTPANAGCERMWVEVTSGRDGAYVGRLLNRPQQIETLAPGAEIEFEPRNVAGYDWDPAELGYDASLHAWVSGDVVRGTERPLLVTRRQPGSTTDESDSGWTVGNGDEPDAGLAHFGWSPVGWLTNRFPELEPVFRAGSGNWRWDPRLRRHVRV